MLNIFLGNSKLKTEITDQNNGTCLKMIKFFIHIL